VHVIGPEQGISCLAPPWSAVTATCTPRGAARRLAWGIGSSEVACAGHPDRGPAPPAHDARPSRAREPRRGRQGPDPGAGRAPGTPVAPATPLNMRGR
jgi:hypothetical protein